MTVVTNTKKRRCEECSSIKQQPQSESNSNQRTKTSTPSKADVQEEPPKSKKVRTSIRLTRSEWLSKSLAVSLYEVKKATGDRIVDEILQLLQDPEFDLENFRKIAAVADDCVEITMDVVKGYRNCGRPAGDRDKGERW